MKTRRFGRTGILALLLLASTLGIGLSMGAAVYAAPGLATGYQFQSIASPRDATFTQLLGINDQGTISGYYGSGAAGHPNKGFTLTLPNTFTPENYPGSAQTQVVGIDNTGATGGFYVDAKGNNHGFLNVGGRFITVDDPQGTFNQILSIHNGVAAGTYQDKNMVFHPYDYDYDTAHPTARGAFTVLPLPNAQATSVANRRMVAGFSTTASGGSQGFLLTYTGGRTTPLHVLTMQTLAFPSQGVTVTQAFGVNNAGQVVGQYNDAMGTTHGFLYANGVYHTIDFTGMTQDGKPATATTVNGINDKGQIVGFYMAANGNTVGFVGTPLSQMPGGAVQVTLQPQAFSGVTGNATLTYDAATDMTTVTVSVHHLEPGSIHPEHIHAGACSSNGPVLVALTPIKADAQGNGVATTTFKGSVLHQAAYINVHLGPGLALTQFTVLACGVVGTGM
jgi:probable HAF family extracellular repeat protein